MQKELVLIFSLIVIIAVFFIGFKFNDFLFNNVLSLEDMRNHVVAEREVGISKAMAQGNYRCCISPPCTMCFMEANQWNNDTAGTCACDDFIAQGQDPCPQCKGAISRGQVSSCSIPEN